MTALASCYGKHGRHQDAVLLFEESLEFQRRVRPENHPEIGEANRCDMLFDHWVNLFVPGSAMADLAFCYSNLGRHQDAVLLLEESLEFQRRVLPGNHPDIGNVHHGFCLR
jgi:pentatricopeptide repeat protein